MTTPGWTDAEAYERYIGRWSAPVAERFLARLALPPGLRWLDVGCGTGVLTRAVLAAAAPAVITGVDRSAALVEHARGATGPPAQFHVGDAAALPLPDDAVDVTVSGLVLNFVSDPAAAMAEAVRVTAPVGTVAAYVWDYSGGMELLRRFWDAAIAVDPAASRFDEGIRFPLCRPEPLEILWTATGLADVAVGEVDVDTVFADFDDLWTPFLGAVGPAPSYLAALTPTHQARLREHLRDSVDPRSDGTVHLRARAWTVRGRVP